MSKSLPSVIFVSIYSIGSVLFFGTHLVDISKPYYGFYFLFFLGLLLLIINYNPSVNRKFSIPILILLLGVLLSSFSAILFWNQGIFDSLKSSVFILSYGLFFLLAGFKLGTKDIEEIIIILAILYMMVYMYSFMVYPNMPFGDIRWYDNRGFPRILIPGLGFVFLFSFHALGKFFYSKKLIWLLAFILSLVFIAMTLTRTLIAFSMVYLSMYAIHKSKQLIKALAGLFIIIVLVVFSQFEFFQILTDQTVYQTENLDEDIRIHAIKFYLGDFQQNIITKVFGNGEPYNNTYYFYYVSKIEVQKGLFTSDIGYFGLYTKHGILPILAYLLLIFRTAKLKVPDNYLVYKYYLYFIFTISIIISSTFSTNHIIPIVLSLYVLSITDLNWNKQKYDSAN